MGGVQDRRIAWLAQAIWLQAELSEFGRAVKRVMYKGNCSMPREFAYCSEDARKRGLFHAVAVSCAKYRDPQSGQPAGEVGEF